MKNTPRFLCVGEAMVELSEIDFSKNSAKVKVAGDTLNTAIYLKRLMGSRASVDYLTVLGFDEFSDQIVKYIKSEHIGVDRIRRINSRIPGVYAINTDFNGERTFSYWRNSSAARTLFENKDDFNNLDDYDFVYYSGVSLAILSNHSRENFLSLVEEKRSTIDFLFDSNYRPSLWGSKSSARTVIERASKNSKLSFFSLDDHKLLRDRLDQSSVIKDLVELDAPQVILKRGAMGPFLIGSETFETSFKPASKVIDSTAAGDSFNAGFIAAYAKGLSFSECAQQGHDLASIVVGFAGAICPKALLQKK